MWWKKPDTVKEDPFEPNIVDVYKERGASIADMAEPVNTFSNISFMVAGLILLAFTKDWIDTFLAFNVIMIGIGSFMYHARPNLVTYYGDVIPITIFVLSYVFIFFNVFIGLNLFWSCVGWTIYMVTNYVFMYKISHKLEGSADYIPVITLLFLGGTYLLMTTGIITILLGSFIAIGSLIFRMYDNHATFRTGTHFMWHILNSYLLMILVMTKIFFF